MPIATVNTVAPSTQRGRYCSGPVKNSRTSTRTTAAKTGELGDLTARARPVRHGRLGRAAVDHECAADGRGGVGDGEACDVGIFVDGFAVTPCEGARGGGALGDDHDEA